MFGLCLVWFAIGIQPPDPDLLRLNGVAQVQVEGAIEESDELVQKLALVGLGDRCRAGRQEVFQF